MGDQHQVPPGLLRRRRIEGAEISAMHMRKVATETTPEADRAEATAWSIRMEGYVGPA
jgi:hypothetical protein